MEKFGIRKNRYSSTPSPLFWAKAHCLLDLPRFRYVVIHAVPLNTDEMWNSMYYMVCGGDEVCLGFINWAYRIGNKFTQSTDILLIYVPCLPG
jgi:hypothetical protein